MSPSERLAPTLQQRPINRRWLVNEELPAVLHQMQGLANNKADPSWQEPLSLQVCEVAYFDRYVCYIEFGL